MYIEGEYFLYEKKHREREFAFCVFFVYIAVMYLRKRCAIVETRESATWLIMGKREEKKEIFTMREMVRIYVMILL